MLRSSGREIFRELQKYPKHFKNVKVYASKYAPANAVIRNLVYRGIKLANHLNLPLGVISRTVPVISYCIPAIKTVASLRPFIVFVI